MSLFGVSVNLIIPRNKLWSLPAFAEFSIQFEFMKVFFLIPTKQLNIFQPTRLHYTNIEFVMREKQFVVMIAIKW